jgi:hypothetical protein
LVAAASVTQLCDQNHQIAAFESHISRAWDVATRGYGEEDLVSVASGGARAGLDALFLPDSAAVIGATERPDTVGRTTQSRSVGLPGGYRVFKST